MTKAAPHSPGKAASSSQTASRSPAEEATATIGSASILGNSSSTRTSRAQRFLIGLLHSGKPRRRAVSRLERPYAGGTTVPSARITAYPHWGGSTYVVLFQML